MRYVRNKFCRAKFFARLNDGYIDMLFAIQMLTLLTEQFLLETILSEGRQRCL